MGKILLLLCILLCIVPGALPAAPAPVVTITASPAFLNFTYQSGATTLPKAQKVAAKASSGNPVFTTTIPATDFWLTVSLDGGTLPASLSVNVNPTGLEEGAYASSVTVTVVNAPPAVVVVNLNVTFPPATLTVNPATLAFAGPQGLLAPQIVTLSTDSAPISYTVASGAPWMTVSAKVGIVFPGQQDAITVTVDATLLTPSAVPYVGKLTVVASGAPVTTKSQSVAVSVTVASSPPSILSIWPPSLPLNGPAQVITIRGANFYAATLAALQPGATPTTLATTVISGSALQAVVPAAMLTAVGSLSVIVENPAPGGSSPVTSEPVVSAPIITGLFSAASYASAAVSPGELVTIFGTNIGPATPSALLIVNGYVSTTLSNVTVTIAGVPAPILYVSVNQVTVQIPYEVGVGAGQAVVLTNGVFPAANSTVNIAATAPGIFTADGSGAGQAAAINTSAATGAVTLNSATNPAKVGDTVTFYLTGEGGYDISALLAGGSPTGFLVPATPASLPQMPTIPTVQIGGVDATPGVSYAGVVPGSITGVLQINVPVPTGASTGAVVPVAISIAGNSTQTGITINVHP